MRTRGKRAQNAEAVQQKASKEPKEAKSKSRPKAEKKVKKEEEKEQIKQSKVEQEKPKEQEKKAPKPKKYLNKNYEQLSRINRSKYQKIYLLEAERSQDQAWNFMVQGASGSNYRVKIEESGLNCTCTDFRIKKKPCKHIYFIVTQVAQNLQILDYFNNSAKISKAAYKILDDQLAKRLKSRLEKQSESKEKEEIDLKDDTDCTICFTEMDKETESLEGCTTCKKYFHFECLSAWKKHNATCPLCRSKFAGNADDPLGKLKAIQLHSQDN